MSEAQRAETTLITLTVDIVSAHVSNNSVLIEDLPRLIKYVHSALNGLGTQTETAEEPAMPAVSIRASLKPDYLICLEDGKKFKMLKRHLMTRYQMTPTDYRAKWKLPADYPMVAPNYAEKRRTLAISIGLGRKPKAAVTAPATKTIKKAPARKKLSIAV